MATYATNEWKPGLKVMLEGDPCSILENEYVKPGKGQAFNRVKLRNLKTARVWERTFKSGDTVVKAFVHAGIWALVVISLLLWLTLRRITDVLMTMVPLLVAGAVTLELCVLIELPLNFANIVALPLLLGVGVAFKIYYVTAWREGRTNLLQSSLTRAIFFSALTTATAFGSLWLSSHPGTASMGKLLALSFVITLAAVLLFQPALMGKPRDVGE